RRRSSRLRLGRLHLRLRRRLPRNQLVFLLFLLSPRCRLLSSRAESDPAARKASIAAAKLVGRIVRAVDVLTVPVHDRASFLQRRETSGASATVKLIGGRGSGIRVGRGRAPLPTLLRT